jgi:hypothetical protein
MKGVQFPSRNVHIARVLGDIETGHLSREFGGMVWLDTSLAARFIESL